MTLLHYFFSPRGRISRMEYWLGMVSLVVLTLPVASLIDPAAFKVTEGTVTPPSAAGTLWGLAVTWPSAAIAIKRFNDRDWPYWTGYALAALVAMLGIANHFGLLLDPEQMSALEKIVLLAIVVALLWSLIENGFSRGTPGPNQYGPDPLEAGGAGREA
jgi:uncharacterized membrane protein YhaH (DUF805 family)